LLDNERAAREEAEQASRIKDEFLATLSHELRTPLNAVFGWARTLRKEAVDPAIQSRGLASIERNSMAQVRLVEDLLDISRIVTGKVRLDVRAVDLPGIIESAVDAVRPAAVAKHIEVQTVLHPRMCAVMGDADRLQQVVWNLVSNAVKFTPRDGRVTIRMSTSW
jgi:signal transduction histidine kinase